MTVSVSDAPAQPRRLTVRFEQTVDRLSLTYRSRHWGRGCALLVWLIGWTVGCVYLAGEVRANPNAANVMFAVPFWSSWIFVFFVVLKSFF